MSQILMLVSKEPDTNKVGLDGLPGIREVQLERCPLYFDTTTPFIKEKIRLTFLSLVVQSLDGAAKCSWVDNLIVSHSTER